MDIENEEKSVEEKQLVPDEVKKKNKKIQEFETKNTLEETIVFKYRLDLYTSRGLLKASIPKAVFAEMSRKYGDVIRSVHSSKWSTIDEIVESYYNLDKRLRFEIRKTVDQIKLAVEEMAAAGMIQKR